MNYRPQPLILSPTSRCVGSSILFVPCRPFNENIFLRLSKSVDAEEGNVSIRKNVNFILLLASPWHLEWLKWWVSFYGIKVNRCFLDCRECVKTNLKPTIKDFSIPNERRRYDLVYNVRSLFNHLFIKVKKMKWMCRGRSLEKRVAAILNDLILILILTIEKLLKSSCLSSGARNFEIWNWTGTRFRFSKYPNFWLEKGSPQARIKQNLVWNDFLVITKMYQLYSISYFSSWNFHEKWTRNLSSASRILAKIKNWLVQIWVMNWAVEGSIF